MSICRIDGCGRPVKIISRGVCARCYSRHYWRRDLDRVAPRVLGGPTTYASAHSAVRRKRGPATDYPCVGCGQPAAQWSYSNPDATYPERWQSMPWRNRDGSPGGASLLAWSPDVRAYDPRCAQCHSQVDQGYPSGHECEVPGCHERVRRVMCDAHRWRVRHWGDPRPDVPVSRRQMA